MVVAAVVDGEPFEAVAVSSGRWTVVWWLLLCVAAGCGSIGKAIAGPHSWAADVGHSIDNVLAPVAGPFWPWLAAVGTIVGGVVVRRRRRARRLAVGSSRRVKRRS